MKINLTDSVDGIILSVIIGTGLFFTFKHKTLIWKNLKNFISNKKYVLITLSTIFLLMSIYIGTYVAFRNNGPIYMVYNTGLGGNGCTTFVCFLDSNGKYSKNTSEFASYLFYPLYRLEMKVRIYYKIHYINKTN